MIPKLFQHYTQKTLILTAILAILGLLWISWLIHPFPYKVIGSGIWLILLYAAMVDWKTHLVHDAVPLGVGLLGALYCFITSQPIGHWGLGLGINGVIMGVLYVLSRKSIGAGDVKLMIALGVFLGPFKSFYLLFHASWLGALFAVIALLLKKMNRHQEIPFIPFIAVGYLLAISSL